MNFVIAKVITLHAEGHKQSQQCCSKDCPKIYSDIIVGLQVTKQSN